jgi:hypothetical protein
VAFRQDRHPHVALNARQRFYLFIFLVVVVLGCELPFARQAFCYFFFFFKEEKVYFGLVSEMVAWSGCFGPVAAKDSMVESMWWRSCSPHGNQEAMGRVLRSLQDML